MINEELKPCFLCGSKAYRDEAGFGIMDNICCSNNECTLWDAGVSNEQWNTRPIEDALQAENARLKQTIISLEVNCDSQSKANYEIKDKYLTVIEKIQNKNNDFKSTLEYVQGWLNKCSNDKKTMSAHKAVKQFVDQVLNNKDNYNEK